MNGMMGPTRVISTQTWMRDEMDTENLKYRTGFKSMKTGQKSPYRSDILIKISRVNRDLRKLINLESTPPSGKKESYERD